MNCNFLVVGAGLAGAVIAERLARGSDQRVVLVDRRQQLAGMVFDYVSEDGIRVQAHGPHIFHTNSDSIFNYLSRFTEWNEYEHRAVTTIDGNYYPFPINLDTLELFYGRPFTPRQAQDFIARLQISKTTTRTSEDYLLSKVGPDLYEAFFKNYTLKQWGVLPNALDASVAARVPIRFSRDSRYFNDTFQGMPRDGYTAMITRMLNHPNIEVKLEFNYRPQASSIKSKCVVYTGMIDEYFDWRYGALPYRSLRFEHEHYPQKWYQPVAVVNYPGKEPFTRITEFKHFTGLQPQGTRVVKEIPQAVGEPYYPVPMVEARRAYMRYQEIAEIESDVFFGGRLGTYRYLNMDQVISHSFNLYVNICKRYNLACGETKFR